MRSKMGIFTLVRSLRQNSAQGNVNVVSDNLAYLLIFPMRCIRYFLPLLTPKPLGKGQPYCALELIAYYELIDGLSLAVLILRYS